MVNLEPLIASERDLVYQVREFEEFRRSFVVNIASSYFCLLAHAAGRHQPSAERAPPSSCSPSAPARFDAAGQLGRQGFLEVQRSLQSWLQAEATLIDAEENLPQLARRVQVTLGMPVDEPLDIVADCAWMSRVPDDDRRRGRRSSPGAIG